MHPINLGKQQRFLLERALVAALGLCQCGVFVLRDGVDLSSSRQGVEDQLLVVQVVIKTNSVQVLTHSNAVSACSSNARQGRALRCP